MYIYRILTIIFVCLLFTFSSKAQSEYPTVTKDGITYYIYEVQPTEGFFALTRKFGVDATVVMQLNPEAKQGLRTGQRLLIPVKAAAHQESKTDSSTPTVLTNTTQSEKTVTETIPTPVTANSKGEPLQSEPTTVIAQSSDKTDGNYFVHIIKAGETLSSIARSYNITVKDIEAANAGLTSYLRVGFPVRIPRPQTALTSQDGKYIYHTIEAKETLYSLSQKYSTSMQDIMDQNPGLNEKTFAIGKVVRIQQSEPTVKKVVKPIYDTYKVKKKSETLYSISRKFEISLEDLIAANPDKSNIQKGDIINIPTGKTQTMQVTSVPVENIQDMYNILAEPTQIEKDGRINVALLLPFSLNDVSGKNIQQSRYIEFYEGFLLAVDSLKNQGISFEIHAYDTDTKNIDEILASPAMEETELIIGPARSEDILKVADWANRHQVNMVNPFTFDSEAASNNPHIFQLNTPNSYLYTEAANEFVKLFGSYNIVFVKEKDSTEEKKEVVDYLQRQLNQNNIKYHLFEYKNNEHLCMSDSLLNLTGPTVFVPMISNKVVLGNVLPSLHFIQRKNSNIEISVFGYPEWQTYTEDFINLFYELNTYFYTRIYVNPFADETKDFYEKYKFWYGKELISGYPKYGLLGFDTGMFFLKMANRFGKNFDSHIDMIPSESIQTAMCFKRINNWSGFINHCQYFVNFRPTSTIQKIEVR